MAPKKRRVSYDAPVKNTLVLDNGAYTLKAGLIPAASTPEASPGYGDCTVAPNCIARSSRDKRTYIGSGLEKCKDFGELAMRRPVEHGFIVNWEAQTHIWEHELFGKSSGDAGAIRVCRQHDCIQL